jgi:hypothetical protein
MVCSSSMKRMTLPFCLLDLLQHALEAVLELATVLGTGDERAHVKLHDLLVLDGRGHVARCDALCQALDDGGLADAGLADEDGVVLRAAAEHLDGAANLLHATDDRVELALAGEVRHVASVLLQRLELRLRVLRGHALVTAQVVERLLHALARDARAAQRRSGVALLVRERAQQVLARDVAVAELGGELLGFVAHATKLVADAHLAHVTRDARGVRDGLVHLRLDLCGIRSHALDDGGYVALVGLQQRLQQVDGANLTRLGIGGYADGGLQRLLGRHCPLVESHAFLPSGNLVIKVHCSP